MGLTGIQTMSQNNKSCLDCKHFKVNWFAKIFLKLISDGKCKKYSVPDGYETTNWCVVLRTIEKPCGPLGLGWERR